jgi:hypothetical protein
MNFDRKIHTSALSAALILASSAPVSGNEISFNQLRSYLTSASGATDPGVMVVVGIGLIVLRVIIARKFKRRGKEPLHS